MLLMLHDAAVNAAETGRTARPPVYTEESLRRSQATAAAVTSASQWSPTAVLMN
jgi:hypothetical protein